ncbi:MAG: dephospho-CoA kinase [Bacteroidales bacterium]|jgi:dephospho-CoA kinase|nr:dephospho-CoA kinase [Bacteroidales bacterium]
MIKIGITGGIGTGKTYIARHFQALGVPLFDADNEAKKLYEEPSVMDWFKENFGNDLFTGNLLDFGKLRSLIFSSKEARDKIEEFIHPLVIERFEQWAILQTTPSVMMESAIIYEAHLEHLFDKIIVVDAPLAVRIERIRKRNPNLTQSAIEQIIAGQMSQEDKCARADWVIWNG